MVSVCGTVCSKRNSGTIPVGQLFVCRFANRIQYKYEYTYEYECHTLVSHACCLIETEHNKPFHLLESYDSRLLTEGIYLYSS